MRLITRPACKRLLLLFIILGAIVSWAWFTMIRMPLKSYRAALPPLTADEGALRDALKAHVVKLGTQIGERNVFRPDKLSAAAVYLEESFAKSGYKVRHQIYEVSGGSCENLEVEIRGQRDHSKCVIVGAHYDSISGSPGANDNASGVAALLELAQLWGKRHPRRSLYFVAFVNEEPPFFQTEKMGSLVYARDCLPRRLEISAMLSLETIAYYSTTRGSQKYPFPLGLAYPLRGDFIAFVSNTRNAALLRQCLRSFREQVAFPSEGAALPAGLPGIGWSDHWAFWQMGYPALMITDTAPFRYPFYHTEQDTPDKIDYDRVARVVPGLDKVIADLVNR